MMRELLADRFELEFHRETQRLPVLLLVRSANGVAPPLAARSGPQFVRADRGLLTVGNQPPGTLTSWLSSALRKPVFDETGLRRNLSFGLQWDAGAARGALDASAQASLTRALDSQLGLSLTEAERSVEMLVVDSVVEPSGMPPSSAEVALPADALDRLVGHYGGRNTDWIVTVRRDADHLLVQPFGKAAIAVYPRSESVFVAKELDADVVFGMGRNRPTSLFLSVGDTQKYANRLDAAAGEAQIAALTRRVAEQVPATGGEEFVRGVVEALGAEQGKPASQAGLDWAWILRGALTRDAPGPFSQRGRLQSVKFSSVAPTGRDVYDVAFERLRIELTVGFDASGAPTSLDHRAIVPPAL